MGQQHAIGRPRFRAPRHSAAAAAQLAGYLREVACRPPYAPEVQRALTGRLRDATQEFHRSVYAVPWSRRHVVEIWREVRDAGRTTNRLSDSFGAHAPEDRERIDRCMEQLASPERRDPEHEAELLLSAHLSHEILRGLHSGLRALSQRTQRALHADTEAGARAGLLEEEIGLPLPLFRQRIGQLEEAWERMTALKNELVERNLGLVLRQTSQFEHLGLPAADLVQEGNTGLLRAAERFDPDRGVGFAAYALWWIRHAIVRAIQNHGRTVRLPSSQHDALRVYRRTLVVLERDLGREPSRDEVAAALEVGGPRVDELRQLQASVLSLDSPTLAGSDDEEVQLIDVLSDANAAVAFDAIERASVARSVLTAVVQLPEREQHIIHARYGLDGAPPRSFREIGEALSISGERARQLEGRAIEHLRERLQRQAGDGLEGPARAV